MFVSSIQKESEDHKSTMIENWVSKSSQSSTTAEEGNEKKKKIKNASGEKAKN